MKAGKSKGPKNNRTELKGKLEAWINNGSPKQRDATTAVTIPDWQTRAVAMKAPLRLGVEELQVHLLRLPHRKRCTRN